MLILILQFIYNAGLVYFLENLTTKYAFDSNIPFDFTFCVIFFTMIINFILIIFSLIYSKGGFIHFFIVAITVGYSFIQIESMFFNLRRDAIIKENLFDNEAQFEKFSEYKNKNFQYIKLTKNFTLRKDLAYDYSYKYSKGSNPSHILLVPFEKKNTKSSNEIRYVYITKLESLDNLQNIESIHGDFIYFTKKDLEEKLISKRYLGVQYLENKEKNWKLADEIYILDQNLDLFLKEPTYEKYKFHVIGALFLLTSILIIQGYIQNRKNLVSNKDNK